MNNIARELGYRFQLTAGDFSKSIKPGGKFYARMLIKTSYAPIYNKRWVEIILKNNKTEENTGSVWMKRNRDFGNLLPPMKS